MSGTDLPALGFGMGDVVLRELLADRGLLRSPARGRTFIWCPSPPKKRPVVLRLARQLRDAGCSVEYGFRAQGVGKQLKNASAPAPLRGFARTREIGEGVATVRDLSDGSERSASLSIK